MSSDAHHSSDALYALHAWHPIHACTMPAPRAAILSWKNLHYIGGGGGGGGERVLLLSRPSRRDKITQQTTNHPEKNKIKHITGRSIDFCKAVCRSLLRAPTKKWRLNATPFIHSPADLPLPGKCTHVMHPHCSTIHEGQRRWTIKNQCPQRMKSIYLAYTSTYQ